MPPSKYWVNRTEMSTTNFGPTVLSGEGKNAQSTFISSMAANRLFSRQILDSLRFVCLAMILLYLGFRGSFS